jgi:hypothetical protein
MSLRAFRALLRLAKAETEARALLMAEAERALALAEAAVVQLDAAVERERITATAEGDSLMAYGAFFKRAQAQRQTLAYKVQTAAVHEAHVRAQLTAALVEQKKLETVVDQSELALEAKREAIQRAQQDEAATLRFAQRSKR